MDEWKTYRASLMCTRSSQTSFTNIVTMATVTKAAARSPCAVRRHRLTRAACTHQSRSEGAPTVHWTRRRGAQGLRKLKREVVVTRGRSGNPRPPGLTAAEPWAFRPDSVMLLRSPASTAGPRQGQDFSRLAPGEANQRCLRGHLRGQRSLRGRLTMGAASL